ncbi:MAG: sodium/glutamate symporter [Acidobacteria bacterium]|nr:sodium/glutamate symporter [Acidobacteriota bacterium]
MIYAVATWKLNTVQALAPACLGAALGVWLRRRIRLLDRLEIPAPVAGGLVFAVAALVLRDRWLNIEVDSMLRDLLQVAFFTTIGMNASARLVRQGGPQVLWLWGVASVGALLQNLLGIGVARAFGLNPLLGIVAGAVSLAGGPATALAFGPMFEKMGAAGATTLGVAAATFGITVSGLCAGFVGGWLIRRYRLRSSSAGPQRPAASGGDFSGLSLFRAVILIGVSMGAGTLVGGAFERLGWILPAYIGSMLVAAALRQLDDRFGVFGIPDRAVAAVGATALQIFIVMALVALRLWELVHLAVPMLVLLAAQVVLTLGLCVILAWRAMGRSYEAAVMAGGFCGFMLGITANAVASMSVLEEKYGAAPRAFIVVPLVGAFLIDFSNALIITAMANLVR